MPSRTAASLCCRLALLVSLAALLAGPGTPASWPEGGEPAGADHTSAAHTGAAPPALGRARHLRRLGADRWHAAGFRGQGVKVAVLDSGFSGYRTHLGRALPARVAARSFRLEGGLEAKDSQHGILCAEAVHAIAPDAELLLANWEPSHPGQFLEAVRWAIGQGARVITCSIIMPTWSDGEGGGAVHEELARLLGDGSGPDDVLFFACAGNTADRHWSGPFRDAGRGWHSWSGGRTDNPVTPWHGVSHVSVELCAERGADLELCVMDGTAGREVRRARVRRQGQRCAVVRFRPQSGHSYSARVRVVGGRAGRFHLFVLGGGLGLARAHGSIPFPGDGPEVVTVGAVDPRGRRARYSSCGPNSRHPKPDLVAPVPFASSFRAKPFAGTSAATPQAAALAALLWSRHPDWTAGRVRRALAEAAQDLGPHGHDWETGQGLIRLPH